LVQRAGMVLQLVKGNPLEKVADYWHCTKRTVKKWADRFFKYGTEGLSDLSRIGRPPIFTPDKCLKIIGLACQYPGESYLPDVTHWSARSLAGVIKKHFKEKADFKVTSP